MLLNIQTVVTFIYSTKLIAEEDIMSEAGKLSARTADDEALERTLSKIDELGLEGNLIELETIGYTTVKGVLSEDRIQRAKNAILRRVESNTGKKIDPDTATAEDLSGGLGVGNNYQHYMLYDDEVFEEILMEEKPLALVTYLLGESCHLSSVGCHFKGPGAVGWAGLHADTNGPQPFPLYANTSNVNYALTPYSREAGALCMVPGSHKRARRPTPEESALSDEKCNPEAVSMNISPGDAVVWHGNAWHGSFARQIPGIRMNLAMYFVRYHVVTQERDKDNVPQEVLDRHAKDDRFKRLLGGEQRFGWSREDYVHPKTQYNPRGYYD